ncbi:MAG: topoisomerase C-terminal repeat-containing protein [Clostridia bacterium]|nr:topoisomerase C-terminal repeat-containing protein [Clostridia bacterium]
MVLIIAEKPSLARNIAAAIGKFNRRDGYLEGNGYIITWAFGHLFSLCDIEDYSPTASGRWTLENIPCFPQKFKFQLRKDANKQVDSGVKKQFEIISALCARQDVDKIVNAGDADREGEIIVRLCIENAKTDKEVFRLWLPDQTEQTVRQALNEMKSEREYDNLANEGLARTYIDWLYGVNLTRYATLKTGVLLRVGRVIIPVVKAIYDRDMAIRNFVPDVFYSIKSNKETNGQEIELISKAKFEKNEKFKAQQLADEYNLETATVKDIKRKKDVINPGKLYSLSKLQNFLGKKYKMPMEQSLAIVQKLYESGYLTYPRTNSEYLATAEKDKIKQILASVAKLGYPVVFKDKKTIFDDSKIESHSAITPTYKIPQKDNLTPDEFKVYSAVMRRFVAVFCAEECIADKTEITIGVGEKEDFVLKGTVIVQQGWTKYDDFNQKDKILPSLNKGDTVNIHFQPYERETSPPKHYTIETLNNYLKNPFRDEKNATDENDEEDYRAIFEGLELGTEATRTGIIDNARKSEYIELKKDVYKILPRGEYLIESLMQMGISMDKYKTSEMGKMLKQIYRSTATIEEGVRQAEREIASVFQVEQKPIEQETDNGFYLDKVGQCPLCGKDVIKGRYGYGCTGYKDGCKFKINGVICKRVISKGNAELLLKTGKTSKIEGFISKAGKEFSATLKLENGEVKFDFN